MHPANQAKPPQHNHLLHFPGIESRAKEIKRTLGLPRAAGYLRNKGVSHERAVQVLLA